MADLSLKGVVSELKTTSETENDKQSTRLTWLPKLGVFGAAVLVVALCGSISRHTSLLEMTFGLTRLNEMGTDTVIPADQVEVAPPRAHCSRIGESCKQSNCCTWTGYQCFQKDETWSSCLKTCKAGQSNGDEKSTKPKYQKPKPGPNGEIPRFAKPFFKPAPKGPWTCKRRLNLKPARRAAGTTLFCFTVALSKIGPGQAPKFQEPQQIDLVKTQHHTKSSIFGCEMWSVFSDVPFELTPGPPRAIFSTVIDFPKPAVRPNTKLWVNTLLMVNVWKRVFQDGHYANYDWTVKVDPTTIFLPIRLRKILRDQKQTDKGIYLENCKYVRWGFHGSLEVMDKKASSTLAANVGNCLHELPWDKSEHSHFIFAGEDKFMQRCMDLHGVDRIPSTFELGQGEGLHTTITCPAHVPAKANTTKWHPPCNTTRTAAMHPFKKPELYFTCLKQTEMIDTITSKDGQYLVS